MQIGGRQEAIRARGGRPDAWICSNWILTRELSGQVSDAASAPNPGEKRRERGSGCLRSQHHLPGTVGTHRPVPSKEGCNAAYPLYGLCLASSTCIGPWALNKRMAGSQAEPPRASAVEKHPAQAM